MVKSRQNRQNSKPTSNRTEPLHQLRMFLKREYTSKKPLEAKLIRLKPNTVFKKGTMLPNLIIKMKGKIQYLIYLDFGDEIRLYSFDQSAMSLGAENHPKNTNILKELYGKSQTLLKLPKTDPLKNVDIFSKKIQQEFTKRVNRLTHIHTLPPIPIPTISSLKTRFKQESIRLGVFEGAKILNINKKLWKPPLLNFLYDREVFLAFLTNSQKNSEEILLTTLWSLIQHPDAFAQINYHFKLNKKSYSPLIQKFWEWVTKRIFNLDESAITLLYSHENSDKFLQFLFHYSRILHFEPYSGIISFQALFLLWLMKGNYSISMISLKFKSDQIRKAWIISQLLKILIENSPILEKYNLSIQDQNLEGYLDEIWYYYVTEVWRLKLKNPNDFSDPIIYGQDLSKSGLYQEYIKHFSTGKLTIAKDLIPHAILSKMGKILHEVYELYFATHLLKTRESGLKSISLHDQGDWKIFFENKGDWILYNIKFFININPQSRAEIMNICLPKMTVFDTKAEISFSIRSKDIRGKINVTIGCTYDNPFIPVERAKFIFWEKELEIQE